MSKTIILFRLGVSQKWITIRWSCKKFNNVVNSSSSEIWHFSNAICLASSKAIHLMPSLILRRSSFSNISHFNGMSSLACGSSLATERISRLKRLISWHSCSEPAFVLSTAKTLLNKWELYSLPWRDPKILAASEAGSRSPYAWSAWVQTRKTGGSIPGRLSDSLIFEWWPLKLSTEEATDDIQESR